MGLSFTDGAVMVELISSDPLVPTTEPDTPSPSIKYGTTTEDPTTVLLMSSSSTKTSKTIQDVTSPQVKTCRRLPGEFLVSTTKSLLSVATRSKWSAQVATDELLVLFFPKCWLRLLGRNREIEREPTLFTTIARQQNLLFVFFFFAIAYFSPNTTLTVYR